MNPSTTESVPLALLTASLHLSEQWDFAVQEHSLHALKSLARQLGDRIGPLPVFIAGNVFKYWNPPPKTINLALRHLPDLCYAVPGYHDLREGNLDSLPDSAYGTLVESRKVMNLEPGKPLEVPGRHPIRAWGFPYGVPVTPHTHPNPLLFELAVASRYVWVKGKGYAGAREDRLLHCKPLFAGYEAVALGSNSAPWEGGRFWNNGAFFPTPRCGILHADGTIQPHAFKVEKATGRKT